MFDDEPEHQRAATSQRDSGFDQFSYQASSVDGVPDYSNID